MTNLRKYPISAAFSARYTARTGFSLDDPDQRFPTVGLDLAQQLNAKSTSGPTKADLLLAARGQKVSKQRSRSLAWLAPLSALAAWPDHAQAHDHHPPSLLRPEFQADRSVFDFLFHLVEPLAQMDLSQPIFTFAIGAALMMQAVGIRQRQLIFRSLPAPAGPVQADLFPETVACPKEGLTEAKRAFVWETDAATRQGLVRKENQDAVRVLRFADSCVALIVCDGAGGIEGGREASQSAVMVIGRELQCAWEQAGRLAVSDLRRSIDAARQEAFDQKLTGVTTALVVALQDDELHYATLGDGAIAVVWPDGMVGQVQVPHHTAGQPSNIINAYIGSGCQATPRVGTQTLEPGAIVMAMTDGASDLFPFDDFALSREDFHSIKGLPDHLLKSLEEARDPETGGYLHSDNLTLAMARLKVVEACHEDH